MPSSGVQTCALDRKSTRLNSSHTIISYAVFCLKKKEQQGVAVRSPIRQTWSPLAYTDTISPRSPPFTGLPDPSAFSTFVFVLFFVFFLNDRGTPEFSPFPLPAALPI